MKLFVIAWVSRSTNCSLSSKVFKAFICACCGEAAGESFPTT